MAGDELTVSAPAKINLYLKIHGRREDGYHFLTTLMQKIDLTDTLTLRKLQSGIRLRCPGSNLPINKENIACRAAILFFEKLKERIAGKESGIDILLKKNIPIAGGLGGGSSDAAAVLTGLDRLYGTNCTIDELHEMALALGADVPQFMVNWPNILATGIGEKLHRAIPLRNCKVLLVNPGISVSTQWVYENFALTARQNKNNLKNSQNKSSDVPGEKSSFERRSIRPDELENDLETVTARQYPIINSLKNRLLAGGASAALMSGSGPSVFGLFPYRSEHLAVTCYQEVKKEFENTFLVDPL